MDTRDSLLSLKGVGDATLITYGRLGLKTIADLINYYPRTYEDYSKTTDIAKLRPGVVTIKATIGQVTGRYVRRGLHITEAIASDMTGSVRLIWFNQPYRATSIKSGKEYFVSGDFELSHRRFSIMSPSIELVSDFPLNTARIIPIYRETKGLSSRQIRAALNQVLPLIDKLPETLPLWLVRDYHLMTRHEAMAQIHFPSSPQELERARERLGFEEVLTLSLASLLNKYEIMREQAPPVPFEELVAQNFVSNLPFKLTDAQKKAIWRIYLDMQKKYPMNRLLEGDVGSGKTVVAAMVAVMVLHHGHQVALMAPTEILARQHAETITKLLRPLGLDRYVGLLTGSMSSEQKKLAHTAIANGSMRFIIGTHALIQDEVDMHKLELIIIDEQHRFGVNQRKALIAKAGHMPHVLNMTATPIPRSLALTLYGELDISVLDTKPPGRQPIKTTICSPNSRQQMINLIKTELETGRQVFVVCPLITTQNGQGAKDSAAFSAEAVYDRMRVSEFKEYRIGLLHGKMKATEKNDVMQAFLDHDLDIIVSTTVIEVGVDVPNASVMLIEAADRFGLAQIHQLRGRIGRGGHPGFCYLMMSDSSEPSARLRALERTNDGFKLAELDLDLRGPGAIYGTTQHGQLDLRIAKLSDVKLIERARQAAQTIIDKGEDISKLPQLNERVKLLQSVTNLN